MRALKIVLVLMSLILFTPFAFAEKININTADQEILDVALDGIGPKKAQAIIDHRQEHGMFKSVDDLTNVPGIGPKTLEKNRHKITVGEQPASAENKETDKAAPAASSDTATESNAAPQAAPTESTNEPAP